MSIQTILAHRPRTHLISVSLIAIAATLPALVAPAAAQEASERPKVSQAKAKSPNSTTNLVHLLVEQGVIDKEKGEELIKQAEDEAYVARTAAREAASKADQAASTASAAAAAASPPGSKRVTYVPDIVKRELREDIRREVMAQAKTEGWASPGKYPEWASRIRLSGDIRGRFEGLWYPGGSWNAAGQIVDFNAINTGSPYNVSPLDLSDPATYNSTEDRNRFRLRARLGLDADLMEGFTAGLRLATGSDSAPVSTNQTLGGSGGNFSKYSLWLDRAFLKYEPFKNTDLKSPYADKSDVELTMGRFDNPFWTATDLVYDTDLGFDGLAVKGRHEVSPGITPFAVAGAFPIFNTNLNFATNENDKFESDDKYLLGAQVGVNWQATEQVGLTFGAGVFDFSGVQGELSSPCDVKLQSACDTDSKRPSFAQKGNTYMPLRDIIPPVGYAGGPYDQPQYFGLASKFMPVVLSARADLGFFDPIHVAVDGEFVWNAAFDEDEISRVAVNNLKQNTASGQQGAYDGGNMGWMARVTVGHQKLAKFGDWNASLGYKYLESDAVMDAFADSDFGLGGTNLKGYIIGANYALSQNVYTTAKWLSASSVAGEPYSVDTLQLDVNAKF